MTTVKNIAQKIALGTALGLGTLGATSSAKAAYVDLEYGSTKQQPTNQAIETNSTNAHIASLAILSALGGAVIVGYNIGQMRSESKASAEECQRILQSAEELNEARKGHYQI